MNNQFTVPDFVQELLAVSNKGVDQIVLKLSMLLSYPILVTDPSYQILLCSTGYENIAEMNVLPTLVPVENPQSPFFHCQISTNESIKEGLTTPITLNNKNLGYLIVFSNDKQLDDFYFEQILHFSASLCALQFQKKLEIKVEKRKYKEAFLFDLLYGNIKQSEDIIEHGKIWGWDFTVPHIIIVFSFIEYDYFFTDKNVINTLLQLVEKELILQNLNPIAMVKQSQIITLIPLHTSNDDKNKAWLEGFVKKVLSGANNLHTKLEIACGIGKKYSNPSELFRSYQEAKIAFELGILLKIETPFFSDLGLERILYRHDLQDLREYFDHTIGSLLKYDANHEGNLIETLEALTANQFDMGKTSNALFLHRNTLRYRVKKIEEILNVKLDDLNTRLNITAAFKIKLLRKL
jgi:sugar diacid utilization regulator